jgi:hypothetical protein
MGNEQRQGRTGLAAVRVSGASGGQIAGGQIPRGQILSAPLRVLYAQLCAQMSGDVGGLLA